MNKHTLEIKRGNYWMKYSDHYIIDSLEKYDEYLNELNNKFSVSESEIKSMDTFVGHGHSSLTSISGYLAGGMIENKNDRLPMLFELKRLYGTVISNQIKSLLDGEILAINSVGGYFPIMKTDEYRILETVDEKYTKEDFKITKWYGGKHFYAKIDTIDVVDESGNVKWFTEEDAELACEKYLEKLNRTP